MKHFIADLWVSFYELPLWVRVWTFIILAPVNLASIFFLDNPCATLIAILAVSGILLNMIPMFIYRGFTDAMTISHVVLWIPLVAILLFELFIFDSILSAEHFTFLLLLLICDVISLAFDIPDFILFLRNKKIID